jgi:hypothetical protein
MHFSTSRHALKRAKGVPKVRWMPRNEGLFFFPRVFFSYTSREEQVVRLVTCSGGEIWKRLSEEL